MSAKKTTAVPDASATITYADKVYASRTLFLPDGRALIVARGRISVSADEAEPLAYLDQRQDFERLQE